jgi:hypothetical protein
MVVPLPYPTSSNIKAASGGMQTAYVPSAKPVFQNVKAKTNFSVYNLTA